MWWLLRPRCCSIAAGLKFGLLEQGWTLLLMGPLLDRYVSSSWVFEYEWVSTAMFVLLASCSFAVLVNVTQFACLGRFSAVSFQVGDQLQILQF